MPAAGSTVLTIGHSTQANRGVHRPVTAPSRDRAGRCPRGALQPLQSTVQPGDAGAQPGCERDRVRLPGVELGGRSEDPACYDAGRIDYKRLGGTPSFQKGLDRVALGATGHRIVLMCAEREPLECHRCLLVAPALEARGVAVTHIRSEGGLELHGEAMHRLLALHGMQDSIESQGLFPRSRAERIEEAIARQARRFAHRSDKRADDSEPPGRRRRELHT